MPARREKYMTRIQIFGGSSLNLINLNYLDVNNSGKLKKKAITTIIFF